MSLRHLGISIVIFAATTICLTSASAASRERVLHNFVGAPSDCANPQVRVIADAKGNLYGTTSIGGTYNKGCVFEISPQPDGSWTESVLYSFSGPDGQAPDASLVFDASGNLYG